MICSYFWHTWFSIFVWHFRKNLELTLTMNSLITSWYLWPTERIKLRWKRICNFFSISMQMFLQLGLATFSTNWKMWLKNPNQVWQIIIHHKNSTSFLIHALCFISNVYKQRLLWQVKYLQKLSNRTSLFWNLK